MSGLFDSLKNIDLQGLFGMAQPYLNDVGTPLVQGEIDAMRNQYADQATMMDAIQSKPVDSLSPLERGMLNDQYMQQNELYNPMGENAGFMQKLGYYGGQAVEGMQSPMGMMGMSMLMNNNQQQQAPMPPMGHIGGSYGQAYPYDPTNFYARFYGK